MISENLKKLQERINSTGQKIGRNPEEIILVAVTKNVPVEKIKEVVSLGVTNLGENRVQEALKKYEELAYSPFPIPNHRSSTTNHQPPITNHQFLKWHLVGHLQRNKVKYAVKIFDLIHSVDDFELAGEIDKQAEKINKVQDCLIEVKVSPEATKYGCPSEKVEELIKQTNQLNNIRICGLMVMAPFFTNPEETRPYFHQTFKIFQEVRLLLTTPYPLSPILSMGMTNDFIIALEEGANMLRIGRAIFGERG